jgi:hypothetical protein
VLKNVILHFINLHLYLKEFVLNYTLLLKQLCNYIKQSQHLPLSLMLMTKITNTASIGLTAPMEAVNKSEDETTVYTKAVEGAYTKELNNIEEIKE